MIAILNESWCFMTKEKLQYMVGGLLYMPAFQTNIVDKIKSNAIADLTSIAFCLEDAIRDEALDEAEDVLCNTLHKLTNVDNLPLIFIRIRTPAHLQKIHNRLSDVSNIITGYILPKFDLNNAEYYAAMVYSINRNLKKPFYVMPILETEMIADIFNRNDNLVKIKKILDVIKNYVLNIRIGVNDLSALYGLRRDINHTVYDIGVLRDIFVTVINIFAKDYIVASSVWNYFNGKGWQDGLINELQMDRLNGFIGKSAIHPAQLPYIYDSLKITQADLKDAEQILNWQSASHGVAKIEGRMNELKCHTKWAQRIKILSEVYGVKDV